MNEWRGEKTGSAFLWSSRRKSDVVPVTRYFLAITAFFSSPPSSDHGRRQKIAFHTIEQLLLYYLHI